MRSDPISRRNRANAKKSTGPRTGEGKAKVARNALQHGATAQPDGASIATWLAIILDKPDLGPGDLLPAGDLGYRALALARAEVQLVAARNALYAFEKEKEGSSPAQQLQPAAFFTEVLGPRLGSLAYAQAEDDRVVRHIMSMYRLKLRDLKAARERRRKLLTRYLSEARSKRRRAFAAWLETRQRQTEGA